MCAEHCRKHAQDLLLSKSLNCTYLAYAINIFHAHIDAMRFQKTDRLGLSKREDQTGTRVAREKRPRMQPGSWWKVAEQNRFEGKGLGLGMKGIERWAGHGELDERKVGGKPHKSVGFLFLFSIFLGKLLGFNWVTLLSCRGALKREPCGTNVDCNACER
jgi:hypothetical protein